MGLWYGASIFAALRLASVLFESFPYRRGWFCSRSSAVTGAAAFSQVGTTMNEVPMAFLVLAGLLAVSRALPPSMSTAGQFRLMALGGLILAWRQA